MDGVELSTALPGVVGSWREERRDLRARGLGGINAGHNKSSRLRCKGCTGAERRKMGGGEEDDEVERPEEDDEREESEGTADSGWCLRAALSGRPL